MLNQDVFYQRLILDQGYWPDGLLTAPSDEALKKGIGNIDIEEYRRKLNEA